MPDKTAVSRRGFLKSAGAIAASAAAPLSAAAPAARPNVLLIMADDLGRGDLACCGARDMKTPHLDRLFARGITMQNFRANCCVCSPSRAALLTGRFQDMVGVPGVVRTHDRNSWGYLDPKAPTLPGLLRKAGYHTALVGKWHLGLREPNIPNDRGFDEFHGFLGDMMDDYYNHLRHGNNYMRRNRETIDPDDIHATELFTAWSIEILRERAKKNRPFFQFLAYNAPHTPIQPPPEWVKKVTAREKDIDRKRAKLVAFIEHLDHNIGKVLDELDRLGLAKNTLVIFTSDNGGLLRVGANNGPWRSGKTHVYEGGLRVPTCAAWPGTIASGTAAPLEALTMDIMPTVLAAAGAAPPADIEGRSFLPTLLGKAQEPFGRDDFFTWLQRGKKKAMIRGHWKLVCDTPGKPFELYDLKKDPREENDLAATRPEKFAEMKKAMADQMARAAKVPWTRPGQKPPG